MATQTNLMTPRMILRLVIVIIVVPLAPLIISGAWDWWEAWAYATLYILGFLISRILAARRHPDIIAERARSWK